MINIGIIGTAGRKDDYDKLDRDKFFVMMEKSLNIVLDKCNRIDGTDDVCLVSGGAAWADHIAVMAYIGQPDLPFKVDLKLHLPCEFLVDECQYIGTSKDGLTANYYHDRFSLKINSDSLKFIQLAIEKGAKTVNSGSFKARNTQVAKDSDVLIALTFGDGAKLKDGGTADTMEKFIKLKGNKNSYHIDLTTMTVYNPAIV